MRAVIDREGRLFGLINVIDALVLALVVTLAPALYYGYRLVHQPPPPPPQAPPPPLVEWITVCGEMMGMTYEALALVSVGDAELDANGEAVARVEAMEPLVPVSGSSRVVVALRCVREQNRSLYKGRPVKVGSRISMGPDEWDGDVLVKAIHRGQIDPAQLLPAIKAPSVAAPNRRVVARLALCNILQELAEVIRVGDHSADDVDHPTMRVTAVSSPAAGTALGLVTVYCELELMCSEVGGQVHYRGGALKVGQGFVLETPRYSLLGTLVDVTVVEESVEGAAGV